MSLRSQIASGRIRRSLDLATSVVRWPTYSVTSARMVRGLLASEVSPMSVIDVGANRGQFAVAFLELSPQARVVSFEPNPEVFAKLSENCSRYGQRWQGHGVALGESPGELELMVNAQSQASSFRALAPRHEAAFPDARNVSTVKVPVRRLDDVLDGHPIDDASLLKIDVQGFEREVLAGGEDTLQRVRWVLLECSFKPLFEGEWMFREMLDFMEGRGFAFERPTGLLRDPNNDEILQIDALFTRRPSAQ